MLGKIAGKLEGQNFKTLSTSLIFAVGVSKETAIPMVENLYI